MCALHHGKTPRTQTSTPMKTFTTTMAVGSLVLATLSGCQAQSAIRTMPHPSNRRPEIISWCGVLSPDAYRVLREQGTEPRFRVSFGSTKTAFTCAWDAARNSSIQRPNSRAAVAGPASTNPRANGIDERVVESWHAEVGGRLQRLRRPPWSRLRRWAATDRIALLHQQRVVCAERQC